MKYIAVICANRKSKRASGGWECWIEDTWEDAANKAINRLREWGADKYIIRIGTLDSYMKLTPSCAFHEALRIADEEITS